MNSKPYLLHAMSPLHAGTGQATDVIDLPINRMRHTNIPIVPGSSIKGVLRDTRRPAHGHPTWDEFLAVFGPETENASDHASAIQVSDARLLALPVRSFKGVFVWVTSPYLLHLARRDLLTGSVNNAQQLSIPNVTGRGVWVADIKQSLNVHRDNKIYLEDLDLPVKTDPTLQTWSNLLQLHIGQQTDIFSKRFALVDDDTMAFLWSTAVQVDTRIRLNPETRTTQKGALWTEESLPPETILLGLFSAYDSKHKSVKLAATEVIKKALPETEVLQFGGKATVGRGICRIVPM